MPTYFVSFLFTVFEEFEFPEVPLPLAVLLLLESLAVVDLTAAAPPDPGAPVVDVFPARLCVFSCCLYLLRLKNNPKMDFKLPSRISAGRVE